MFIITINNLLPFVMLSFIPQWMTISHNSRSTTKSSPVCDEEELELTTVSRIMCAQYQYRNNFQLFFLCTHRNSNSTWLYQSLKHILIHSFKANTNITATTRLPFLQTHTHILSLSLQHRHTQSISFSFFNRNWQHPLTTRVRTYVLVYALPLRNSKKIKISKSK